MKLYEIAGDLNNFIYPDLDTEGKVVLVSYQADRIIIRHDYSQPESTATIYVIYGDEVVNFISFPAKNLATPPQSCQLPRYDSRLNFYPRLNRAYSRMIIVSDEFAFIIQTGKKTIITAVKPVWWESLGILLQASIERADDITNAQEEEAQSDEF